MPISRASPDIDRGLTYAEACFETFRVIRGEVFCWQAHMDRLAQGLDTFGMSLPEGLKERCLHAARDVGPDVLLRLTVSGGPAAWGLKAPEQRQPGVYIQAMQYRPRQSPVSLHSVNWPFPLRKKAAKYTSDYAETLRALRLLEQSGLPSGDEALICDEQRIYSGTTANVLVYREDRWWMPRSEWILPGVVRGYLLQAGAVSEADCPRTWVNDCTALALTNSGSFVQPISTMDGRKLASDGAVFDDLWQVLNDKPGVPGRDVCS